MTEYQEFTGKTVEEALRNARENFGVTGLDDLDFEILTPGSRGVLGMGAEPARIIAAPRKALGGAAPRREAGSRRACPRRPSRGDALRRVDDRGPADDRAPPRRPPATIAPATTARRAATARRAPGRAPGTGRSDDRRAPDGAPRRSPARRPRAHRASRPARRRRGSPLPAGGRGGRHRAASLVTEREEIRAAEASPEALAAGKEILEQLVELMGFEATVPSMRGATSKIDISGADDEEREALGALIGRKGERLSALQHLVNLMLSRRMGEWTRVLVDVEDYRGRRERQLGEIAVAPPSGSSRPARCSSWSPCPHSSAAGSTSRCRTWRASSTQSIGEEPMRRVVVIRA